MQSQVNAIGRGCSRSTLIYLIAAFIVVPLSCCLVFAPMAYVMNSDSASMWYLVIPLLLFLAILFGGSLLFAFIILSRRNRKLDEVFTPLGLQGSRFAILSRRYTGTIGGREVSVTLSRGPLLHLRFATPLQTRLGATGQHFDTNLLAGLFGQSSLDLDLPGLAGLRVFAGDEAWARHLLAEPVARGLLQRLVLEESWFTRRQVLLDPGVFTLLYSGSRGLLDFNFGITPEDGRRWLADLQTLVRLAESLPPPAGSPPVDMPAAAPHASPAALPLPPTALSGKKGAYVIIGVLLFIFLPGALVLVAAAVFMVFALQGGLSP